MRERPVQAQLLRAPGQQSEQYSGHLAWGFNVSEKPEVYVASPGQA